MATLYFRDGLKNKGRQIDISTDEGMRFEVVQQIIGVIERAGLSVDDFAIYRYAKGEHVFLYGDESIERSNDNFAAGTYCANLGMFDVYSDDPVKAELLSDFVDKGGE